MYTPSRAQVRAFFRAALAKERTADASLSPLEAIAARWAGAHPEYADELEAGHDDEAVVADASAPRENPFLHLSMHLAIEEQLQIDRPLGIRAAFETLAARRGSAHAAHHEIMECLGRALWEAQRSGKAIDDAGYLDCVLRRASGR